MRGGWVDPAVGRLGEAPPGLSARETELIVASTGQELYGYGENRSVAIASTTKMMTALITLEHAPLQTVFTQNDWYPAPADSQIGLAPGERMTVHDLLLAMLLPSADDAAEDLAYNVGRGSVARFVGMMNTRAAQLGLTHTRYSTPIGLDTPGNYSSASDLVKLASYLLAHEPWFARAVALPGAGLGTGPVRYVTNLNDLVRRVPWIHGVKTGHTLDAGYVLVGSGTQDGMTLVSAVLGTPSESARDDDTLALLSYGFGNFHSLTPVVAGRVLARPTVQYRPGVHAELVAASTYTSVFPRSTRLHIRVRAPGGTDRPVAPARGHWLGDGARRGRFVTRIPLLLARALAEVSPLSRAERVPPATLYSVPVDPAGCRCRRRGGVSPAADPDKSGCSFQMIITITLNAALDKTLEVPNFTPGRRHRTVDQTTMPGGKGVNIARAIKRLGQPVIATGLAGGATGTRIVEALSDEAILNDFVRIREESRTNTAVLDPTTGLHTEINERGPLVSAMELELFRDKLLYLAKGASMCVFAGSLPRGVEPDMYAGLIREVKKLGVVTIVDTDGDPLHLAVRAEPNVVSPNELEAEELVGHEFNDDDDRAQCGGRDDPDGSHPGDHDRQRRLLRPDPRRRVPDALPRADRGAGGTIGHRLGRRVPGRLRGGPVRRPFGGRVPALRGGVWRGVDPALRRRPARSGQGRATPDRCRGRASGVAGRDRVVGGGGWWWRARWRWRGGAGGGAARWRSWGGAPALVAAQSPG